MPAMLYSLTFNSSTVPGKFDYSKEFYLGPRHEIVDHRDKGEAGGYHSIVPFTLDSGQRILVDRGYVSNRTDSPVGSSLTVVKRYFSDRM